MTSGDDGSPLFWLTTLPSFMVIRYNGSKDINLSRDITTNKKHLTTTCGRWYFVSGHMFLNYHVTKCSKCCVTLLKEASQNKSPPSKFGKYRPCGSWDITDLVFDVTFQDPADRRNLMEGSYLLHVPTRPKLVAIDILVMHILSF